MEKLGRGRERKGGGKGEGRHSDRGREKYAKAGSGDGHGQCGRLMGTSHPAANKETCSPSAARCGLQPHRGRAAPGGRDTAPAGSARPRPRGEWAPPDSGPKSGSLPDRRKGSSPAVPGRTGLSAGKMRWAGGGGENRDPRLTIFFLPLTRRSGTAYFLFKNPLVLGYSPRGAACGAERKEGGTQRRASCAPAPEQMVSIRERGTGETPGRRDRGARACGAGPSFPRSPR